MYFCLVNTGAICVSWSATCWRARSCCFWLPFSSASMWEKSSTSNWNRNKRARAHHRIRGHQLWMGKALVDVFVDDVRLVENQVALDQDRQPVVRVHHRDVFGLVVHVHVDDLKVHALFVQHDAAALRERAGGSGVEIHHVCLPCRRIRIDVQMKKAQAPGAPRLPDGFSQCTSFQNSL